MFCLQPLRHEDSVTAALLHRSAFYLSWSVDTFESLLGEDHIQGKKIIHEDGIRGIILWRVIEDEAEILTFVVEKTFQKQGLGTLLLNTLLHDLKRASIKKLFLEVAEDNYAACRFYCKNFFKIIGRRPNYYQKGPQQFVDALNLELTIFEQKRF